MYNPSKLCCIFTLGIAVITVSTKVNDEIFTLQNSLHSVSKFELVHPVSTEKKAGNFFVTKNKNRNKT